MVEREVSHIAVEQEPGAGGREHEIIRITQDRSSSGASASPTGEADGWLAGVPGTGAGDIEPNHLAVSDDRSCSSASAGATRERNGRSRGVAGTAIGQLNGRQRAGDADRGFNALAVRPTDHPTNALDRVVFRDLMKAHVRGVAWVDVEGQRSLARGAQATQVLAHGVAETGHFNLVSRVAAWAEGGGAFNLHDFEYGTVCSCGHQGIDLGTLSENRHGFLQLRAKENPHWAGYWD